VNRPLRFALPAILLLASIVSGCATGGGPKPLPPPGAETLQPDRLGFLEANDPLEPMNRHIYRFNILADRYVMEPVVRVYEWAIPEYARNRVSDFFSNLGDVPVLVNCILQGKPDRAATVVGRLLVNTTAGVGGLWDIASKMENLPKYTEDFGQTLAVYGLGPGPYLMIPLLGPSTFRDAGGRVVDGATRNSVTGLLGGDAATDLALSVVDGLQLRASMPIGYGGLDSAFEYEILRTLYLDIRTLLIHDGEFVESKAGETRGALESEN
jgi:phospholipid-binding lipoprotein MlaA